MASLQPQPLGFDAIEFFFQRRENALKQYYNSAKNPDFITEFGTYSANELTDELRTQLEEIDRDACLALLAAIEAAFQGDARLRVARKNSQGLNGLLKKRLKRTRRVSFENGILKDWQSSGLLGGGLLSDLKAVFNYRHWLAHGRYWEAHLGRYYDYYAVATLAQQVEALLV